MFPLRVRGLVLFASCCWQSSLAAQSLYFAGALVGVSTLSADGRSSVTATAAAVSLYKPENGPVVHLFAGVHLREYLSLQGNYVWNRNSLALTSAIASGTEQVFYEQTRSSTQHGVSGDLLLYFRNRQSRVRPYLSVGGGIVGLRSEQDRLRAVRGEPMLPPVQFASTEPVLRVAVGIDLAISRGWAFRYSFCETIRKNAISVQLSPPGQRNLATFQNLFGFVKNFGGR